MSDTSKTPAQPVTPERLIRIAAIPAELMKAQIELVHSSEQYDLNRNLAYASLCAQQAIIDLLAEVEGLTASRNYGRDIINDMTLEASDDQKRIEKLDDLVDALRAELERESPRTILGWYELSGLPVYENSHYHTDAEGCYFTPEEWQSIQEPISDAPSH